MENSNGQIKLPLSFGNCEVKKGAYLPDILPSEAENMVATCKDTAVGSITCQTKQRNAFIEDAGGLNMAGVVALPQPYPLDLPNYIPSIDKSFFKEKLDDFEFETIVISIEDLF